MRLPYPPSRMTIKRILNNCEQICEYSESIAKRQKRVSTVTSKCIEKYVSDWVYDMNEKEVFVTGSLIQEKHRISST